MVLKPLVTTSLSGVWSVRTGDGKEYNMKLPGTLADNNIGHRDTSDPETDPEKSTDAEPEIDPLDRLLDEEGLLDPEFSVRPETPAILTRYTRKYAYEGRIVLKRTVSYRETPGKRVFLEVERARVLKLLIDGLPIPHFVPPTLVTPHIFEVTGLIDGEHEISIISDNSYPDLPAAQLLASNIASNETQTNWNGLVGYLRLREEEETFVSGIIVQKRDGALKVTVSVETLAPGPVRLSVESPVLERRYSFETELGACSSTFTLTGLKLKKASPVWDEKCGELCELTVTLGETSRSVSFGLRDLTVNKNGRILLNKRKIFLRGETNAAVYPEMSHAPMDDSTWLKIFRLYMSYGVNIVRFKSYCPPEAAFRAADSLGLLLAPELSLAGPGSGLDTEEGRSYYTRELFAILRFFGNHPSFVMLSFGDRPEYTEETLSYARELLERARRVDGTRLYASGSDPVLPDGGVDEESDFIAASSLVGHVLGGGCPGTAEPRGFLNDEPPGSMNDHSAVLKEFRAHCSKPVISYEGGRYSMLPDFRETDLFSGHLEPANLEYLRDRAEEAGLSTVWDRYLEATVKTAFLNYRIETETALRTKELSGIMLAGLQDYPGMGGALYGMMNSHLQKKRFDAADPKAFAAFCTDTLPVAVPERFTFNYGEHLEAKLLVANYGREELRAGVSWRLYGGNTDIRETLKEKRFPTGTVTFAGAIDLPLEPEDPEEVKAVRLTLEVRIGKLTNSYPVFVYPHNIPICPEHVYEADVFDSRVLEVLQSGGTVFMTPPATAEAMPGSVRTTYTSTIFNDIRYPEAEGTMGQYIDAAHPVFRDFPTAEHTDVQWWAMANARAVVLPRRIRTIVSEMDSPEKLRPLGKLFEFRCLNGNVLFSAMGLKENIRYPEVAALLNGIYAYLDSYEFSPSQELRPDELKEIISQRL